MIAALFESPAAQHCSNACREAVKRFSRQALLIAGMPVPKKFVFSIGKARSGQTEYMPRRGRGAYARG